uniref:OSJNBa0091D06.7 protein n=1 Tax=Oryza sativa subsp. japonica TaxID=39947 RepID=Q7XU12_ORYSJ|nr:OSJNBa0091D06.7 [Oryza sativa Japonica Group]
MAKPGEEHAICSNYGKNHHTLMFHVCMHATMHTVTSKPTKWLIAKLYSFGHEDVYRYTLISQVQLHWHAMERRTRNRVIRFCKVQWSNHAEEEATWEREDELKAAHPDLFASSSESRGRDSV